MIDGPHDALDARHPRDLDAARILDLDAARILAEARLRGFSRVCDVHVMTRTGSTSDDARAAAQRGAPSGTLFVADVQDHGRGRRARVWSAPAGSAILASLVLRPEVDAAHLPPLALVVGLALRDVIADAQPHPPGPPLPEGRGGRGEGGERVTIKWPNDVLMGGRKCAGILVEASIVGTRPSSVIVGFGINVRAASLPADVAARATSLEAAWARSSGSASEEEILEQSGGTQENPLDRSLLLGRALAAIDTRVHAFEQHGITPMLDELRAHDGARGRSVRVDGEPGIADGIADDGSLVVRTARGVIHAHGVDFEDPS